MIIHNYVFPEISHVDTGSDIHVWTSNEIVKPTCPAEKKTFNYRLNSYSLPGHIDLWPEY